MGDTACVEQLPSRRTGAENKICSRVYRDYTLKSKSYPAKLNTQSITLLYRKACILITRFR